MNRFQAMRYTLMHKKAFLIIEKRALGKNTLRGYLHDVDKLILYPILGKDKTHKFHRKHSKHHFDNVRTIQDKIQMLIDWESARYTKPDKPLSAFGFMMERYPHSKLELLPLIIAMDMELC